MDLQPPGAQETSQHRILGVTLDLNTDCFEVKVSLKTNPLRDVHTRRSLLSTIASIYDPIGIVAPAVLEGKLVMREAIKTCRDR